MRRLAWVITLPLSLVVLVFSVANREAVPVSLWPFFEAVPVPLFLLLLLPLLIGFICGGAVVWWNEGRHRGRARQAERQVRRLEDENHRLRERVQGQGSQGQGSQGQNLQLSGPPTTSLASQANRQRS